MAITRTRASRIFTISFPKPLAQQVEQTAREESRNISELFREAFRAYKLHTIERKLETMRPLNALGTSAASEAEIQACIDEVRSEMYNSRIVKPDRRPNP